MIYKNFILLRIPSLVFKEVNSLEAKVKNYMGENTQLIEGQMGNSQ